MFEEKIACMFITARHPLMAVQIVDEGFAHIPFVTRFGITIDANSVIDGKLFGHR